MGDQKSKADEFREQQKQEAALQGQTAENAVPEKRPRVGDTPEGGPSPVAKQQQDKAPSGANDPMPMSAFDKAASDEQKRKASTEEQREALKVGDAVTIVDRQSPHFLRRGAVVRVVFHPDDEAKRNGQPSQRFINPIEAEISIIGDEGASQNVLVDLPRGRYPEGILRKLDSKSGISGRERVRST